MNPAEFDLTFAAMAAPFLAAALAPLVHRSLGRVSGWFLAIVPLLMFLHFVGLVREVAGGATLRAGFDWGAGIGVRMSYALDGLSLLFALLITGIGTFIVIYSGDYLKGHPHQGRFYAFILLFMGSMLGLVLADDFVALFVFWEMTSISSFLLIGFDHLRMASRRAAIQALIVTGMGGLSLLAGLLLLGIATGATSLSEAMPLAAELLDSGLYVPVLLLILGGAFTKSAQFPFHFWLPNAMEAPTPVSAYLHSATMVKAGVYLLMRVSPLLGGTMLWETILPVFGGVTLIVGALLAIRQTDIKLILAYTTVASLGLLVLLTGSGSDLAVTGAVVYLFAHSLFKGALFMVAGAIDHETGTRNLRALGGIGRAMPITFAAGVLAAASMGGLPLTIGFFGKETIYEGLLHDMRFEGMLQAAVVLGNALMFAAGFSVGLRPFIGAATPTPRHPHEGPTGLWLGPIVLALGGVAAVLLGASATRLLLAPAYLAVTGEAMEVTVSPSIHMNLSFALSVLTVTIGILIWFFFDRIGDAIGRVLAAIGWGPDRGFDQFISGLTRFASVATRLFQNGNLETYLAVTFAVTAVALLVPMTLFGEWPELRSLAGPSFQEWVMILLALAGVVVVLASKSRLVAIVSLGIQGFAVAVIYMLLGAPDLSFTQFMVETLSVVILALAMTRLPLSPMDRRSWGEIIKDSTIAIACGIGFGSLLLAVTQWTFDPRLSEFFAEYSRQIAHGRNIVNVIIVDFRGLDTLGEITVVMVTGLAIVALLRVGAARVQSEPEAGK